MFVIFFVLLIYTFPFCFNPLTALGALMTLIEFTLSNARRFYSIGNGEPLDSETVNNVKNYVPTNALTAVDALMTLRDFTLSNARRFYSIVNGIGRCLGWVLTSRSHQPHWVNYILFSLLMY